MKTNKLIHTVLFMVLMLFSSCIDIEITTILNNDGSIERIMEVNSDSEITSFAELPFPVDSTWQIDYQLDTSTHDKSHKYIFKKRFANADELNSENKSIPHSLSRFNRTVAVSKKFRWFYTYITYHESYEKLALGNYLPFNQYLSDIEKDVRKLKKSDSIEQQLDMDAEKLKYFKEEIDRKFENWFTENVKNEVVNVIVQDISEYNINGFDNAKILSKRDTIYQIIDSLGTKDLNKKLYSYLNNLFNTNEFDKVIKAEKSNLTEFDANIEMIVGQTGFKYNLQMPGLLIDTNSESIKGNQLSWQFEPIEAFFVDTDHMAESRIINMWAFVVSGVFLTGVFILLFLPFFRNKR